MYEPELIHEDFIGLPSIERAARILEPTMSKEEPFWLAVLFSDYVPSRSQALFHIAKKYGVVFEPELVEGIIAEAVNYDPNIDADLLRSYAS